MKKIEHEDKWLSLCIISFIFCVTILGIFYAGDPDLMDAIIKWLSK